MKKISIFLLVIIITGLCFTLLISISKGNQYTSVRKYTKPKKDIKPAPPNISIHKNRKNTQRSVVPTITEINNTIIPTEILPIEPKENILPAGADITPPVIEFLNYEDGDIVSTSVIDIQVKATDNISTSENIHIEGAGVQKLTADFNPIVVTATDESGNSISAYIVIEKQ